MPACAIVVIPAESADCVDLSGLADSAAPVDLVDFVDLGAIWQIRLILSIWPIFLHRAGWGAGLYDDLAVRFPWPR